MTFQYNYMMFFMTFQYIFKPNFMTFQYLSYYIDKNNEYIIFS